VIEPECCRSGARFRTGAAIPLEIRHKIIKQRQLYDYLTIEDVPPGYIKMSS
jgi:hypothetical protein